MSQFLDGVAHDLPELFRDVGRIIVYTPAGTGIARDVTAIFGRKSVEADFGDVALDGVQIWVRSVAADLADLAQGDLITVDGIGYTVDGIEFDRAGTVLATLIRA